MSDSASERKRRHRDAQRKRKAKGRFRARVVQKAQSQQRHEEKLRGQVSAARARGEKKRGPPKGLPRPERWISIPTAHVSVPAAQVGRTFVTGGYKVELGKPQLVFSAGAFANKVGRTPATIRHWVDTGVLPGPSIRLGGRSYFTSRYISAILKAISRLYEESGVGSLDTLRTLARQELAAARESWIPQGGSEDARVFHERKRGGPHAADLPVPVPESS